MGLRAGSAFPIWDRRRRAVGRRERSRNVEGGGSIEDGAWVDGIAGVRGKSCVTVPDLEGSDAILRLGTLPKAAALWQTKRQSAMPAGGIQRGFELLDRAWVR